jgi:diadenosine tetraphosphate (Ap4A) HIT family hydrolase
MLPAGKCRFELDERIELGSHNILWLGMCELRLVDDSRWPWVQLIPQRPGITEIHEMTPLDQTMLTFETNLVSEAMKKTTGCHKINIAALGNIVPQLHIHVVARFEADPNWPDPVWGYGVAERYGREEREKLRLALHKALE